MTATTARQMQAAYDRMVLAYADRNHGSMPDSLVSLAQRLVRHAGRDARILDVGCGTGRDMAWLEAHAVAVTGIDLSRGMLSYARGHVTGNLLAMHMCRLGFCDASFDGAWCCASLLHVPKSEASDALREIRRVLKAGSMLIVSLQEGSGEGWEESYVPGVRRFVARYGNAELRRLLRNAGFSVRKISDVAEQRSSVALLRVHQTVISRVDPLQPPRGGGCPIKRWVTLRSLTVYPIVLPW